MYLGKSFGIKPISDTSCIPKSQRLKVYLFFLSLSCPLLVIDCLFASVFWFVYMSLLLLNLGLLGSLFTSHNNKFAFLFFFKPLVRMNQATRQRKKKPGVTDPPGRNDYISKPQPFVVLPQQRHFHVLLIFGFVAGLLLFLVHYSSSAQNPMIRASRRIFSNQSIGLARAHSAEHIIRAKKPFLVYGTAWKKERTAEYVNQAVHAGFRFIDTACQPRHYNESGVGEGWTTAAHELNIPRQDFFLQTKFTSFDGQDPNTVPYDPESSLEDQVRQSLSVSLKNLKTDYLDSLVLHSPMDTMEETLQVWRVMETFVDDGRVRRLGLSNSNFLQFKTLYEMARIKPSVAQNRFHARTKFDTKLRHFCRDHDIWYQSFWTLTANWDALEENPHILELAQQHNLSPQTLMFAFLMSTGYITPLSGTTSKKHMLEDVAIMERMQGGEVFFHSTDEMEQFAEDLGIPEL